MATPLRRTARLARERATPLGRRGGGRLRSRSDRALAAHRALVGLAEAATAGLSPAEMLGRVVAAATSLADAAIVHLWVVESDGRTLRLAAEIGERPGSGAVPIRPVLRMGEGLAGAVARSRRPIVVASLRGERRLVNRVWARDRGLVSFAGVPLASVERLLGVLCLFTSRRHRFTRQEVDLLRSFAGHAAVALENAALFDTATRRLRRLETLREIEGEISQQRDPEALLELIGRRATELLEADSATVFLLDEAAGVLRPHASYNAPERLRDLAIPLGAGVAGRVARDRQGMAVNDYPRSPYALDAFRDVDRAVAGQPLLRGETVQGVILVRRSVPGRPFSPEDLVQLGDFAVQASIALENARLLRLAAARAERVQAAAEVGRLLAATRHAERILDLIAEKCREILGAEAFGLFRLDPDGYLRYARGFGLDEAFMREHVLALGEGVVGKAAHERRLVETSDILRDPALDLSPAARARIEGVGSRALVAVPIVRRDEILGVLAVYHPPGFRVPPEEREFLQTLADHAAAALDTARLFDQARRRQRAAETLAEIGQSLTGSLDLATVLSRVAEGVRRLLGSDGGSIGLVDADGAIRMTAGVGLGNEAFRNVVIWPGQGTGGQVLLRGEPFWTADYLNDPRISRDFAEAAAGAGLVAELALPVRLRDETVGVLWASYERPVQITDDDVGLATNLAQVVAVAVANARLYAEARQREAEARALFEVGRLIGATLDPERVLDLIVEKVRELMGVRACGIFRLDEQHVLHYARGTGLSPTFVRELRVRMGEGTAGRSVAERAPVWTPDILADSTVPLASATRALVAGEGYRAVLSVPIVAKDAPFGCLATYWWEPHTPTPGEIATLSSLAALAGIAIENARLYGETREHVERLQRLNQLQRAVSASLRLDEVLAKVVEAAGTFFGAPVVTLLIADEGERVLARRAAFGDTESLARIPARLPYGQGIVGWVAEHRQPLLDVSVAEDPRALERELLLSRGITAVNALPILLGERLLGVLAIGGRREAALSPGELALLQTLIGQAAVAIENARLYEEAQRAYQNLKTAQDHLVQAEKLRALGEMASGVAHDFNNILAAILGRVQLMLTRVEDATLRHWLEIVERAALDGAQTVRRIQEFTRVRRDQPTETVDLAQVLRDAVEMTQVRWRDEAQSRGFEIRLVTEIDPVPPVDGQSAELRQALTNLILNAVDALPQGGTITVGTRLQEGAVEVSVADTGVGMPEAVRRRIFEPFFSTKGPRGTGLGLAMVYGIVSRHGGEVSVESREGTGSTFTIRLPVARGAPLAGAGSPAGAPEAGARVLVIEDEERVRDTLADMLRQARHEVVVASRGAEGLERFRSDSFDLVVTDLGMPGMSGWQVALAVKALRPEVPVVLVTGWGVELPPEQLRASGVDRVMTKPIRFDEVREVVASLRRRAPPASGQGVPG
ncbi:MAG: GAF domain-containing protein [Candidatus Rokubacteria bacterium]|nr:GAF domain-containing protein [Candidatus Rokubacteria bacterium]